MTQSISDLRLSITRSDRRIAPLPGRVRPAYGTEFGVRGHVPALKAVTCRRSPKICVIVGVAVPLPRLRRRGDSSLPMNPRALQRFGGSAVDQFPNRQASL